jgi:hypothetical protein
MLQVIQRPNMALNLAPFGRWTLRDKAASAGDFYVLLNHTTQGACIS